MIVTIKADVFNNPSNKSDLNDLMHFFRKGKHRMNLKKVTDFEAFENSDWKNSLSRTDFDILKEGISRIDKKEIVISQKDRLEEFNLKEAFAYLNQNLRIILEQEEYEKPFILKIIQEFDSSIELIKALQNSWLEFYNGSGSNSESILRTRITRDISTNQHFKDPLNKYLRFYELKDSDRTYCKFNSDGSITQENLAKNKTKFLESEKIPYHVLFKREKENYLPDSVFNSLFHRKDKKDFVQVYLGLTPHQKDFLDIEKGFTVPRSNPKAIKNRDDLKSGVRDLYSNLTEIEFRKIGFGLPYENYKSTFSNNFIYVSKEDLEKRIQHQPLLLSKVNPIDKTERNEFEHIIHEIKFLL